MADVFLSYKREDAAKVRKLVGALRAAGLETWWDEDIPGGAQWEATIEKALAEAKAVIVCWSPASISSENVRSEARIAREDRRLVQVFLKPCSPPLFFGERQGFDLSKWRGNPDDPRIGKIADCVRKIAAGERAEGGERPKPLRSARKNVAAAVAGLLLLIAAAAAWWTLRPTGASGPVTLAVLPFRALNPADTNLVDAIWDDTRGAISRNPNLRVIGRQAVEALAERHLEPRDYRKKLHADYLLDGSVEHVGSQVQMKLSLVRTADAAEVWSDQIGGKLDDVFAFQQRIAGEVEGRIRGRVAPGGGVSAKNIATSGEVYALYAEALAKIRQRNGPGWLGGRALLKKAVAIDPNYAPAWAELAIATKFMGQGGPIEEVRSEAVGYARRALTLAPNLAHAHAALAFAQDFQPESEGELRRAVALDPSDAEAWMWLGNCLVLQNRLKEALEAHARAVEIEPLWHISMYNKMDNLGRLDDRQGIAAELRRAETTGDPYLALRAREHTAYLMGQIAAQMRYEFEVRRRFPDRKTRFEVADVLMQLGYVDEGVAIYDFSPAEAAPYKGRPISSDALRRRYRKPVDFWLDGDTPNIYGRLLPKNGRLAEYVGLYKAAFQNADDFYSTIAWASWEQFADAAPTAAANLRKAGENVLAQQVIDKEESIIAPLLRNGPANRELAWNLAQLRAVEGRDDEAMSLLRRAIDQGWLPDRIKFAIDIAEEPAFAILLNRSDFQAVRRRIIAHIEDQRRQITPAMLAEAGVELKTTA
jgi:TolB-like protein/Tfp pilus assembly protein PilF